MPSSETPVGGPFDWRGRLTFAFLQEPPFCFRDGDGRVPGCDVESAEANAPGDRWRVTAGAK